MEGDSGSSWNGTTQDKAVAICNIMVLQHEFTSLCPSSILPVLQEKAGREGEGFGRGVWWGVVQNHRSFIIPPLGYGVGIGTTCD